MRKKAISLLLVRFPRSDEIIRWEDQGKTVIEGDENSEISEKFFALARKLLESEGTEMEGV